MRKLLGFALMTLTLAWPERSSAKTVKYELNITRQPVNLSGKKTIDWALMVNGSIPAPTLEFTEGDTAEIVVNNKLDEGEVSIHWHGILLPPIMDGVPYVNTPPIHPGKSFTFKFKIRQHGTYWYHSHTGVQEQKGVYGGLVIHPAEPKIAADKEAVLVLSDWSDENSDQILANLRKDGDYYLYKKKSIRSWYGAIRAGQFGTMVQNEWDRMGGMDLSDVGYDAFLINGKRDAQLVNAKAGEKIRLRVINAAASSYFYLSLGGLPMKVVSADGVDIEPILADEILIGMAETYDILFEVPEDKNYEFRATVQDVTGHTSAWIGSGTKVNAPDKPVPDLYAPMDHGSMGHEGMDHGQANHGDGDHSKMDHSKMGHGTPPAEATPLTKVPTLTVDNLKAAAPTFFAVNIPRYDLKLVLGGDMERYVWHINGKAINQDRTIEVREGDVVRFTFENNTMMHHPMHLHGHFFRVLNDNGELSPLKHTVDVPPHGSRTIEFYANEPGEWMLHCHNLYHMKNGMGRVVKYTSYTPPPEIARHQKHDPHLHDHIYLSGMAEAATNHAQLNLSATTTWDSIDLNLETRRYDDLDHSEAELLYHRWFSSFLNVTAGATYYSEEDEDPTRGVAGIGYVLPLLIETQLLVDHKGKFHLELEKRFQWTSTVFSDLDASFRQGAKTEFELSLMYAETWAWAGGLMVTEDSVGGGVQYRF
jgi:FtsP/CotA-like multicopper oxidase with cupredoxin domain